MWLPSVALWGFFKILFLISEIIIMVSSALPDEVLLQNNIKNNYCDYRTSSYLSL